MLDGIFVPLIPVSSLSSEEMQSLAVRVMPLVAEDHLSRMEAMFWQQWKEFSDEYLSYAEEPGLKLFEAFLLDMYFPTFDKVLSDSVRSVIPKVDIGVNASQEQILARQDVLRKLSSEDLQVVEKTIRDKWNLKRSTLSFHLRERCSTEPPQKYWAEHYYPEMFSLYRLRSDTSKEAAHSGFELCDTGSGSKSALSDSAQQNTFESISSDSTVLQHAGPTQKSEAGGGVIGIESLLDGSAFEENIQEEVIAEVEFLCSKVLLEETALGGSWQYTGWLLHTAEETRRVKVSDYSKSPSKRKAGEVDKIEKDILDIVLLDDTGPVLVSLWGDCVTSFLSQKQSVVGMKKLVHLSAVSIGSPRKDDWNGECLCTIRNLSTVAARGKSMATVVTFLQHSDSPYIGKMSFSVPNPDACIGSFVGYKSKLTAPFRGNFVGVVADCQGVVESVRGNQKKFFDLVDLAGYWFTCCAWGRNACNKALRDGARIVVFYGTGRSSFGESRAALYLLQDSVTIEVPGVPYPVVKREQLDIN